MIRLALLQTRWLGDVEVMRRQFRSMAAEAVADGASVVGLPEFSLAPYFAVTRDPAGFNWAEPLPGGASESFFADLSRELSIVVLGSLYERTADGHYYDTATVHEHGALIGVTRKVHIPSGDGYHETAFFAGADDYPIHTAGGLRIAAPTCYDQWFPELARIVTLKGAQLIFYPTAIGSEPNDPAMDSRDAWQRVMQGHAVANGVFVAACNRVGVEGTNTFYGSSFVCDPSGAILAQAGRERVETVMADLDLDVQRKWREFFPLLHQRRPGIYGDLLQPWSGDDKPAWLTEAQRNRWQPPEPPH